MIWTEKKTGRIPNQLLPNPVPILVAKPIHPSFPWGPNSKIASEHLPPEVWIWKHGNYAETGRFQNINSHNQKVFHAFLDSPKAT